MKKLTCLFLILSIMTAVFLSCGKTPKASPAFSDMTLEEILAAIYEKGGYSNMLTNLIQASPDAPDSFNYLITSEIKDDNCEYFLGKTGIEFERAIASEANMNPTTYSLCLIKAKAGQDVKELADAIRKNANPMKWVCTGVSKDHVYVDSLGDVVILIMSDKDGKALLAAFQSLANEPSKS